ncbi:hypothetical protein SG34_011430 [Thalassomonas viridans]|uniref:Uncharacterized protein n=1 Tax=Thalassomonas viridans TaxID=137584 RepID=A0AAF0CBI1_9GAMM|nr:hypothetical protein [Thalassomonas viridans]WDE07441.1 hypothetical protein SG34_011430 [Thalassomonas viridans]
MSQSFHEHLSELTVRYNNDELNEEELREYKALAELMKSVLRVYHLQYLAEKTQKP